MGWLGLELGIYDRQILAFRNFQTNHVNDACQGGSLMHSAFFTFNHCTQSNPSAMTGVSAPSDGCGSGTLSELTHVNLGSSVRTDKSPTALDVMATLVNTRGPQTPETTYQLHKWGLSTPH